ncbi:unnamed protein product [Lymnaea stagnalis]|uniref:Chitin-binding type-2 domain-containing protein n=1 Tax=Lymnaea stagnalis TaxID=6523 RepID=A0AAV2ID15_LYMST
MSSSSGCQVTQQCVLDVPCLSPTRQCRLYNERHACRGSCETYAICTFGRYFTRQCPEGHYFDDNIKICVVGNCLRSPADTVPNFPAGISMLPPAIQRIRGYPNLLQDNSLAAFRNRNPTVHNFYSHYLSGNSRNFG